MTGTQWVLILAVTLVVLPVNLLTKLLVFRVLQLGDGEDELDDASFRKKSETELSERLLLNN